MITWILAFLLILYFIIKLNKKNDSRPGPPGYPILGNIPDLLLAEANGTSFNFNGNMHQQYGKTFVLKFPHQPNMVMTMDPIAIRHITSGANDIYQRNPIKIGRLRKLFLKLFGSGIFVSDGEQWQSQRTLATPLFDPKSLEKMIPIFIKHTSNLDKNLDRSIEENKSIDVQDLFKRFTLDTFCELGFGVQIHTLQEPIPFSYAFDFAQDRIPAIMRKPYLLFYGDKQYDDAIKAIDEFVYAIVKVRSKSPVDVLDKNNDLLSRFLCLKDENGNQYSEKFLRDIVLNFTIAGRDSTGQLLSWTFYLLSQHPEVEKKLVEEVKNFNGEYTIQNIKSLKYLDNVVREVLRFYPSVPVTYRIAHNDDILPNGIVVKRGERVCINMFDMHRDKDLWDSPLSFIPERWDTPSLLKQAFQYFPFYGGPRICLGKNLALLQAKTVIISTLKKYKFEVDPEHKIVPYKSVIHLSKSGVKMYIRKREE